MGSHDVRPEQSDRVLHPSATVSSYGLSAQSYHEPEPTLTLTCFRCQRLPHLLRVQIYRPPPQVYEKLVATRSRQITPNRGQRTSVQGSPGARRIQQNVPEQPIAFTIINTVHALPSRCTDAPCRLQKQLFPRRRSACRREYAFPQPTTIQLATRHERLHLLSRKHQARLYSPTATTVSDADLLLPKHRRRHSTRGPSIFDPLHKRPPYRDVDPPLQLRAKRSQMDPIQHMSVHFTYSLRPSQKLPTSLRRMGPTCPKVPLGA